MHTAPPGAGETEMHFASDWYPRDIGAETIRVVIEEMPHIDPDTVVETVRSNRLDTLQIIEKLQAEWDEWASLCDEVAA